MSNLRYFIRALLSFGRGLPDSFALLLSVAPFLLIAIEAGLGQASLFGPLKLFVYFFLVSIGLYYSSQLAYRLSTRRLSELAAKRRMRKTNSWARAFVANRLSDIRRPLQGLIGVQDMYEVEGQSDDAQEYMEIVKHCSLHVVRLINRVQAYADIRSGKNNYQKLRFNLTSLLEDIVETVSIENQEKGIEISEHISPNVLKDFYGHFDLLRILIGEVCDNCVKYSHDARVVVSAEESKLSNYNIVITIQDSGPGLTAKQLKEVQTLLNLRSASFNPSESNNGLGIPLIRSIAKLIDAKIHVNSEIGKGCFFEIHLRLPAYSSKLNSQKKSRILGRSNKILIVDDDPLAQKIIGAMFNRLGYRTTSVSNGHDAVELCRRQKFGLIIMDLEMPIMDGWEASKHILKRYRNKNSEPLVVALTARNSPADRARAEKSGCHYFLVKPLNSDQLRLILDDAEIQPHFLPNQTYHDGQFDGLDLMAGKTIEFNKLYSHYDKDMSLCQVIITQAMDSLPVLLEDLDAFLMARDNDGIHHTLHQLKGELQALLCNAGAHIVKQLSENNDIDSIEFVADLEQLNRYCESLLKELSILAKHNEVLL